MSESKRGRAIVPFEGPVPLPEIKAPTSARHPTIFGLAVIAVAFGGFGTWAAVAPLDSAVVAQGVLAVESKRKTVQHLEGGIVREILVRDGDHVEKGAVLIRLDDIRAQASLEAAQAQHDAARALEARLLAERDGLAEVAFPPDLMARAGDAAVAEAMEGQRSQFAERRRTLGGEIAILEQRIAQLRAEIEGHEIQHQSRQRRLTLMKDELGGLHQLGAKGFYPKNRIRSMERDLAELEGEIGADVAAIARAGKQVGEAQLQIEQARQNFREEVVKELRRVQEQATELAERLVQARDVAGRLAVTAPESGVVQGLKVATAGGVIGAGTELMEIVPSNDRLIVEAQIAPSHIEGVAPGLRTEIRFPGLNARHTPVIEGEVLTVSADRFTDAESNVAYYTARVAVPPAQYERLAPHRLQAGMPVEVMIKTGERTALDYMVKPLADSLAKSFKER